MGKEIVVDVAPDGTVRIEGKGFVGAECDQATRALRTALGTTVREVKKPEYAQAKGQVKAR